LAAEEKLAKSALQRNLEDLSSFLCEDILFYPSIEAVKGKSQVIEYWKSIFELPFIPFTWKVSEVDIPFTGRLAHSSGRVFDLNGHVVCRYMTIWRRRNGIGWQVDMAAAIALNRGERDA
jgi:ketosteroid isomerase-like protein